MFLNAKDASLYIVSEIWSRMNLRRWLLTSCTTTFVSSFFTPVFRGTVEKTFGGQMQFLTIIALFLTSLTLFLNQFTAWNNLTYDLLCLSTTVETVVTVYYWTLFHYNRGLLYPKNMDPIPFFVDIFLHFLPALALWMELLTTVKLHRVSRKHIYIIALFSICYMFWAEYCFTKNGYYVYPILSMLDMPGKIALTCATIFVGLIIYVLSVQIHTIYGNFRSAWDRAKKQHDNYETTGTREKASRKKIFSTRIVTRSRTI